MITILSRTNFVPILDALFEHGSVYAAVIGNAEGFPLAFRAKNSTFTAMDAEMVAALVSSLVGKTKNAVERIGRGQVQFLTIDTTEGEILIALEVDYIVIAIRERKV
ncbi:MAG: roadblock/LC7 domain-containing protein [Candidatus Heimdallarchaeota archaeon]|nr:roadblock/LC7 domain-containing protein [Candidatus Heimdallarchaeota archaeon]